MKLMLIVDIDVDVDVDVNVDRGCQASAVLCFMLLMSTHKQYSHTIPCLSYTSMNQYNCPILYYSLAVFIYYLISCVLILFIDLLSFVCFIY